MIEKLIIERVFGDYTVYRQLHGKESKIYSVISRTSLCSDVFSLVII